MNFSDNPSILQINAWMDELLKVGRYCSYPLKISLWSTIFKLPAFSGNLVLISSYRSGSCSSVTKNIFLTKGANVRIDRTQYLISSDDAKRKGRAPGWALVFFSRAR